MEFIVIQVYDSWLLYMWFTIIFCSLNCGMFSSSLIFVFIAIWTEARFPSCNQFSPIQEGFYFIAILAAFMMPIVSTK